MNSDHELGLLNLKKENYSEAYSDFLKAKKYGYVQTKYNVGYCYTHAQGVEKDLIKAFLLYKKTADFGHLSSINAVGDCCYYGNGVEKIKLRQLNISSLPQKRV